MKQFLLFISALLALFLYSCEEKNINEPEVADQQFEINENTSAGTIIGVIEAYDLDPGQSLSFRIQEGDDTGTFEVDRGAGHISVKDPVLLDYELNTELIFTTIVKDNGNPPKESTAKITVLLSDLNEFAPVVDNQVFEIQEGAATGAVIGMILASDPEAHQQLRYSILSGDENEVFALDEVSGALSVNDPLAFDSKVNTQLTFTVLVRDLHIDTKTDTALITVNINSQ